MQKFTLTRQSAAGAAHIALGERRISEKPAFLLGFSRFCSLRARLLMGVCRVQLHYFYHSLLGV
jgi:hypothetical protein